jgi:hypothetical protein
MICVTIYDWCGIMDLRLCWLDRGIGFWFIFGAPAMNEDYLNMLPESNFEGRTEDIENDIAACLWRLRGPRKKCQRRRSMIEGV